MRDHVPALVVFVTVVAAWEAAVFAFDIQFYLLPAPHTILAALEETWPVLVSAGLYTFTEALIGWTLGCGLAIVAAMIASRSASLVDLLLPWAIASASVPIVALAPLAIVWFGVAHGSKIAIVALMTFFPTFVATTRGLTTVTAPSLELMRSYAASEWHVFARLRLPHALPFLFTALRACTTLAMIGAVVSEFFGGPMKSLGVYIKSSASLFQTRQAWSAILVTCALGLLFYGAVALLEWIVMPWRADRTPR